MAGPEDFFSPGEWVDGFAVPQQVQQAIEDPRLRAGLTQFGLNMLGGGGWGGSFGGDLARGIGGAGEAIGRQEGMDVKQTELGIRGKEAESRADLRASQIENATLRSGVAQQNADTAVARLALAQEKEAFAQEATRERLAQSQARLDGALRIADQKLAQAKTVEERRAAQAEKDRLIREGRAEQDRIRTENSSRALDIRSKQNTMGNRIQLQRLYNDAFKGDREFNDDVLNRNRPKKVIPTFGDWLDQSGYEGMFPEVPRTPKQGGTQGGVTQPTPPPAASASPQAPRPTTAPDAPRDPAKRDAGKWYTTPKGVLYWDGSAWQSEKK